MELVKSFYIQNDALGPYRKFPIFETPGEPFSIEKNLLWIVVPHPPKVNLSAQEILTHSIDLVVKINRLLPQNQKIKDSDLSALFLRPYLMRSNEYKASIKPEKKGALAMPRFVQEVYRGMPMPKYVWVVEISREDLLTKDQVHKRKIVGEILIDSTAHRDVPHDSMLAFHLYGRLLIRDPLARDTEYIRFVNIAEKPYPLLVRRSD